jgi:energy-converting hydrogenase Eha subunit C
MPSAIHIARRSLPLAAISTIICLLVYVTVQQSIRTGANDPQIQMAEDAVRALERGEAIEKVVPAGKVEIERSLAPFLMIYDDAGHLLAGSGSLHGAATAPPIGVFEHARSNGQNRVTWKPEAGNRLAAVILPTTAKPAAYVLAARSLREIQNRADYTQNVAAGALVATFCVILLAVGVDLLSKNQQPIPVND